MKAEEQHLVEVVSRCMPRRGNAAQDQTEAKKLVHWAMTEGHKKGCFSGEDIRKILDVKTGLLSLEEGTRQAIISLS